MNAYHVKAMMCDTDKCPICSQEQDSASGRYLEAHKVAILKYVLEEICTMGAKGEVGKSTKLCIQIVTRGLRKSCFEGGQMGFVLKD